MNPKDKAKELVDKFYDKIEDAPVQCSMYCLGGSIDKKPLAKQCALLCVEEMKKEANKQGNEIALIRVTFLDDVKTEIQNL